MTLHPIPSEFLIYEENFLLFFYQCNFVTLLHLKKLIIQYSIIQCTSYKGHLSTDNFRSVPTYSIVHKYLLYYMFAYMLTTSWLVSRKYLTLSWWPVLVKRLWHEIFKNSS
jgi:hypothetical protein